MRGPRIRGWAGTPTARAGSRPRGAAGPGPRRSGSWLRQRDDGLEMQLDPVGLEGLENEPHAAGLLGRGPAHRRQQGRLGKACRRHLVHEGEPRSRHRRSAGPDAILFAGSPGEVPQEARRSLRPHGRAQDQRSRLDRCPSRAAALRGSAAPFPPAATGRRDRRRRSRSASRATGMTRPASIGR